MLSRRECQKLALGERKKNPSVGLGVGYPEGWREGGVGRRGRGGEGRKRRGEEHNEVGGGKGCSLEKAGRDGRWMADGGGKV